jgi:hypothetical protein
MSRKRKAKVRKAKVRKAKVRKDGQLLVSSLDERCSNE